MTRRGWPSSVSIGSGRRSGSTVTRVPPLELSEYETKRSVELTEDERASLEKYLEVKVRHSRSGTGYDVTAGAKIGAATIGSQRVRIRPKIAMDRVMFLVSYAVDPERWKEIGFGFGEADSVVEAVIPGFVRQVRHALRRGMKYGYRTRDESRTVVRGKIRLSDQIGRRFGIAPPVDIRHDVFTANIAENQLIKGAIMCLRQLPLRSDRVRSELLEIDMALEGIEPCYEPAAAVAWNRLNDHYRPAVALARLILDGMSIELRTGRVRSSGFVLNMYTVFENFVGVALREALGVSPSEFRHGDSGGRRQIHLDRDGRVLLKPDLSWWDGDSCRFIGDVKYKLTQTSGAESHDLYQLLSYVVAADAPGGMLVYAAGATTDVSHDVVRLGKQLNVTTLDVSGTPEQIQDNVRRLAARIRAMD